MSRDDRPSRSVAGATPRRLLVAPGEDRLRAGWRILLWVAVVILAGAVAGPTRSALAGAAPAPLGAVAAVAGAILVYATLAIATLAVARAVDHRPLRDLGFGDGWPAALVVGLALGGAMTAVVAGTLLATDLAHVAGVLVADPMAPVVPGNGTGVLVGDLAPIAVIGLLVPSFVAVGVVEELLVRGYLLTNLAEGLSGVGPLGDRGGVALAILATGGLFGALHLANPHAGLRSAAMIAAVGVVLGWTYAVTDSLGIPIGIHVTWNLGLAAVWGLPVSGLAGPASVLSLSVTGPALVTGGAFGPEAGLVMIPALAIAVGVVAWWARRTTGDLAIERSIARYPP